MMKEYNMSIERKQIGKKYAEAIKNNPGRGKNATKIRHAAFMEYKKALQEYLKTLKKVVKNEEKAKA